MKSIISNLLCILCAILLLQGTSLAQDNLQGVGFNGMNNLFNPKYFKSKTSGDLLGSCYYDSTWQNGSIYLNDSSIKSNLKLRYDLFTREIEIQQQGNDNRISVMRNYFIKGFSLGDDGTQPTIFIKSKWNTEDGKKEENFIKVVKNKGKFTLYKSFEVKVQKPTYVRALQVGTQETSLLTEEDWVIGINSAKYLLPTQKSKAIELFKKYASVDIKPYLKKYKLNMKKEEDMLKLIALLESK